MLRRRSLLSLAIALSFLATACGGGGDGTDAGRDGAGGGAVVGVEDGVTVSGDGFTATFPGQVERRSDPIEVAGLAEPLSAENSTWESDSEALTIITTVLPPVLLEPQQVAGLLEGAASGMGAPPGSGLGLLDADGTFRGRDAVAYEVVDGDLVTKGIAFVDGAQLVQVIHLGPVDQASDRLEELVDSLELSG